MDLKTWASTFYHTQVSKIWWVSPHPIVKVDIKEGIFGLDTHLFSW